ncbi:TetR/AcrR family transcriptional regulator [Actinophytocola xanthii]|uniref:TetR family transcriptional regulator n=1 Tax=Actinophytocola xanthii TaxID=1912961 RepID=A0A1Q8CY62_9PSEU|nr:TetR/AcrR family transcriptional regulator [Actinophytocola xanthii]OLF19294.1 TetR family transcriptional regulator [Actinophytocola xanthii]
MPTPERASLADIVGAARTIVEEEGLANLTMQAVAVRVGVRAPSLYKRVRNRDDLVRLAIEDTVRELGEQLAAVAVGGETRRDLAELCRAFRAFAHAHPAGYRLIFAAVSEVSRPSVGSLSAAAAPVLRAAAELAGPARALEAARTITAWAHGFVSMELANAFNLGGDVERAFEYGISRLAAALTTSEEGPV